MAILNFIKGIPNVRYELLGYHRLGEPKYNYLGKDYLLSGVKPMSEDRLAVLKKLVQEHLGDKQ